jgi:hypothetical protein
MSHPLKTRVCKIGHCIRNNIVAFIGRWGGWNPFVILVGNIMDWKSVPAVDRQRKRAVGYWESADTGVNVLKKAHDIWR